MFGPPGCLTESELMSVDERSTPASWGIFPRLTMDLLASNYTLNATAVEIYQDFTYDLLNCGKRISIGRLKDDIAVTGGSIKGVILGRDGIHDAKCRCGKCTVAKKRAAQERVMKIREQQERRATAAAAGGGGGGAPQSTSPFRARTPGPATSTPTATPTATSAASAQAAFSPVGETVLPLVTRADVACLARTVELSRTAHGHLLNERSSRSHCIVRVFIKSQQRGSNSASSIKQQFCFVDLAGSERIHKSGVTGVRKSEALEINQSLSVLGRVILALGRGSRDVHVPYRDSVLTMLLKSSFDGHSFTSVVINVSDDPRHMKETVSSLRFGESMCAVRPSVTVNIAQSVADTYATAASLREELDYKRRMLEGLAAAGKGGPLAAV